VYHCGASRYTSCPRGLNDAIRSPRACCGVPRYGSHRRSSSSFYTRPS
jgi:hypothetical protein